MVEKSVNKSQGNNKSAEGQKTSQYAAAGGNMLRSNEKDGNLIDIQPQIYKKKIESGILTLSENEVEGFVSIFKKIRDANLPIIIEVRDDVLVSKLEVDFKKTSEWGMRSETIWGKERINSYLETLNQDFP
jgi:hypothetical protein